MTIQRECTLQLIKSVECRTVVSDPFSLSAELSCRQFYHGTITFSSLSRIGNDENGKGDEMLSLYDVVVDALFS